METTHKQDQNQLIDLKPKIRKHWQKITDEDINQLKINGNFEELVKILRKRYGYGKAQAEIEITNWLVDLGVQPSK